MKNYLDPSYNEISLEADSLLASSQPNEAPVNPDSILGKEGIHMSVLMLKSVLGIGIFTLPHMIAGVRQNLIKRLATSVSAFSP